MKRLINCLSLLLVLSLFVSCQKEVSVEQSAPATGSLQNDFGDCLPKRLGGTYVAARALIDSNFIEVTVNVATPGAYTIATDTVNGYSFKATGVFSLTGATKVILQGTGKPISAGVNDFTVAFDTSVCFISIPVAPAGNTGGPATYTLQMSGSNCASTPSGTYVKDAVLTAGNTVLVGVNVTVPGTYSITTNTVNGYSFSGSGTFSATGPQTVTLQGTGKPLAAGTNNFTTTAGTATCPFTITVLAAPPPPSTNTDHFPMTANSWWSYEDPAAVGDSTKRTNAATASFGGNSYRLFRVTDINNTPFDTLYFRRSVDDYYQYQLVDYYSGVTFDTEQKGDLLFLKENLTTGATWTSAEFSGTQSGAPTKIKYAFTCDDANATVTVNGKTFTGVYKITMKGQVSVLPAPYTNDGTTWTFYYAKGIGSIYEKLTVGGFTFYESQIRNWLVN